MVTFYFKVIPKYEFLSDSMSQKYMHLTSEQFGFVMSNNSRKLVSWRTAAMDISTCPRNCHTRLSFFEKLRKFLSSSEDYHNLPNEDDSADFEFDIYFVRK